MMLASKILFAVLGPPQNNVMYIRWEHEIEKNTCLVKRHHSQSEIHPFGSESSKEEDLSVHKENNLVIEQCYLHVLYMIIALKQNNNETNSRTSVKKK
jgi:hypothetical protein